LIERLGIDGVWTFTPKRFGDARGWFSETFKSSLLRDWTDGIEFVQDNHSMSARTGTLRGLHFQAPPRAQAKLVRVVRGAVLDVAVDIRRASPSFGRWVSAVLSADNGVQIFVPKGFAHGFLTLEPNTEVLYKVSDYYAPETEAGLAWDDPAIGIDWGVSHEDVHIAERDAAFPKLADLRLVF